MDAFRTGKRRGLLKAFLAAGSVGVAPAGFAAAAQGAGTSRAALLRALLDRNHERHPEFGRGLSNHLSMALVSLAALEASPAQLQAFAETQWPRLAPLPKEAGPAVTDQNWTKLLGQKAALPGFRTLFAAHIAQAGVSATLRRFAPELMRGVGAGAFHALIRTGYGVRFADGQEVADGLAYWAVAFLPLGPLLPMGGQQDPMRVLAKIHESSALGGRDPAGRLIFDKMKTVASWPEFHQAASTLKMDDETVRTLAAAAVKLYITTQDFTALHMVTGAHAYRLLAPFLGDGKESARYLGQALLAAYVTIGAPRIVEPAGGEGPKWSRITEKAVASLDEHDIKLVEVAQQEESFYKSPLYRRAAALRMKLV